MKITLPNFGNMTTIGGKALLFNLGHEVILPPPNTKKTLDLGVRYSPEYCCLPLKILLGNFIEALEKGAEAIAMVGGWGPCRFGYYAEMHRRILIDLGYEFKMISLEKPRGNLMQVLNNVRMLKNKRSLFSVAKAVKIAFAKIEAVEELEKAALKTRPRENKKGDTTKILKKGLLLIDENNSIEGIKKITQKILGEYGKIMAGNENKEVIKIILVGEFYVALEPFVNYHIEEKLGYLGVEVERGISAIPWISSFLKFFQQHQIHDAVEDAAKDYLSRSVGGEGQNTIGHIVLASKKGIDGAVQVIPFTCMPEIVAETISKKVCEDLDFPVLTQIYDEQTGEEGLITRLEAFVDLLKAKKQERRKEYVTISGS